MTSPTIQELLHNNDVPSEGTIKEIQELRSRYVKDLDKLDTEARILAEQLAHITARKELIQAEISQTDLLLSSIRRVPAYIFYQVFQYCLPAHRNSIPREDDAPLSLTHVCRAWRNIALTSPRLWTRIHITFSEDQASLEDSILQGEKYYNGSTKARVAQILHARYDGIKEWLSRSGSLPLSVSLDYSINRGSPSSVIEGSLNETTIELFALLKSVSDRLENFEFTGPSEIYRYLEYTFSVPEMKALTTLKLRRINDLPSATLEERSIRLLDVPTLKNISFTGHANPFWDLPVSSLEWRKFTDISLHHGVTTTIIDLLLRKCSNLVHFLVVVATNHTIPAGGVIPLPSLVALSIEEHLKAEYMYSIYERIDAPRLKWVNYANYPVGRVGRAGIQNLDRTLPVIQLLQRCGQLEKLTFDGAGYSPTVMRELYQSVHGITVLSIGKESRPPGRGYERDSSTIAGTLRTIPWGREDTWNIGALIVDHSKDSSILLPGLKTLEVFSLEGDIPDKTLEQFIETRTAISSSQHIPALKEVHVQFSRNKDTGISPALLHLAKVAEIDVKINIGDRKGSNRCRWTTTNIHGPTPSTLLQMEFKFPRLLSLDRQIDDYGRTWSHLNVRDHMDFINQSYPDY